MGLALRPDARGAVRDGGDPLLRLVWRLGARTAAHRLSAVSCGPSRELARPSRRTRRGGVEARPRQDSNLRTLAHGLVPMRRASDGALGRTRTCAHWRTDWCRCEEHRTAPSAGLEPAHTGARIGADAKSIGRRPRQDSNLRTRLRRPMLYPLSYEGGRCRLLGGTCVAGCVRQIERIDAADVPGAP